MLIPAVAEGWDAAEHLGMLGRGGQDCSHPISAAFWEVLGSWEQSKGVGNLLGVLGLLGLTGKLEERESPWETLNRGGGEGGWQEREEGDPLSQGDPGGSRAWIQSRHQLPHGAKVKGIARSWEPGTATGAGWDPVSGSQETARRGIPIVCCFFFFLNTLFL